MATYLMFLGLQYHVKVAHNEGGKEFQCHQCGQAFSTKGAGKFLTESE